MKRRPYHNPRWLRKELRKYGSLAMVCRVHGFPEATVAGYLSRHPEVRAEVEDLIQTSRFPVRAQPRDGKQIRLAGLKRYKKAWTVNELQAQGLPFYWDHAWLLEQFRKLRSLEAMGKKYGYKPQTLRRYISRQPELAQQIWALREEMQTERAPLLLHLPPALARELEAAAEEAGSQREVIARAIEREAQKASPRLKARGQAAG
ncbi:hypothetical protein [Meiothermus granaticius]|uniref:Uncharacterized protein n=1 Tax=Meiothermus granaticius NBRC 107808 TaxID=1227551 RepID=A0A399F8D1_9DEIN|nr:hypothetical protein [Meiothermus granaticius]RIH91152.1 hypothetical protein Mgrana_02936 [Meiothermus granaticius NBRC 107808]GEM88352.1 hypothetical protein MGR01S_29770 [Meiothermus granaticius NBRC 107808]